MKLKGLLQAKLLAGNIFGPLARGTTEKK